jgi:predicted aldo/keto reductase-like oxidoreductase
MEPVKGGALADIPKEASEIIKTLGDGSDASFALRYAASYPEVFMVLSGMGNMDMMDDNINTFRNFVPIKEEEFEIFDKVRETIRKTRQIPCTKCNYCAEVCPSDIPISRLFSVYNRFLGANISRAEFRKELEKDRETLSGCVGCGACEGNCPQSIKIREELGKIGEIINR